VQRTETIERHLPLQREAARALGLLAVSQKFEAVELDADGHARVTYTESDLLKLAPAAVTKAAGIALASEFKNSGTLGREEEAAWLNSLLTALDDTDPRRADILATTGDLTTAMAEGETFIILNQPSIYEVMGSVVANGGRSSFAPLNSAIGRKDHDVDARPDLIEMARGKLKPHAKIIKAIDKKVTQLLAK
jgi:hypothetical protein